MCIITETFLTAINNVTRAALHPSGFSFLDQPRLDGSARGGIGLFFRNSFTVVKTDFGEKRSFEYSEWMVSWNNIKLKLCVIYHIPYSQAHPVSDATFMKEIEDYFDSVVLCNELLLIVGDFNIHVDDDSDYYGREFCDLFSGFGLVNHVTVPTHDSGHTLDLIITRNTSEITLAKPRAGYYISDHCFVSTKLGIPRPELQIKTVSFRQIKNISLLDFRAGLQEICVDLLNINDCNTLAKEYNKQLLLCLDRHAPIITKSYVVRPKVPYFDNSLKDLKRKRRKAESNWCRQRNDCELQLQFKQARNKCVAHLDHLKDTCYV